MEETSKKLFSIGDDSNEIKRRLASFNTEALWDIMLHLQYDISHGTEISYLNEDFDWKNSESVLEIGFGSNYPIGSMKNTFPKKTFEQITLDIDYSKRQKWDYKPLTNFIKDQLKLKGKKSYDYIFLRLVAQHVAQPGVLVNLFVPYMKKSTRLLLFDACDRMHLTKPELVPITKMYQSLKRLQDAGGGNRMATEKLHRRVGALGFKSLKSKYPICQSDTQEMKELFYNIYLLHAEVINRFMNGKIDIDLILRELSRWILFPESIGQFGFHFLLLGGKPRKISG